jgi:tetraacyldisaccharide 4'-kinase
LTRSSRWIEQQLLKRWFAPTTEPKTIEKAPAFFYWPEAFIADRIRKKRKLQLQLNRRQKPPVVVIGNLVVGGGGKTPLIVELSRQLHNLGYKIAIICSGYGAQYQQVRQVNANDDAQLHGDEAVLLARLTHCPVFAGKQRRRAYELAKTSVQPDIVLSDDGLQHFGLERALQLVCVDERGFGNQRLLPFGPLREPIETLRQMDGIIVSEQSETLVRGVLQGIQSDAIPCWPSRTRATVFRSMGDPLAAELPLNDWFQLANASQSTVHLVAGIANPEQFFSMMRTLFPQLKFTDHPLADHARFDESLFRKIQGQFVVMTEKDAVKCSGKDISAQAHWFALNIAKSTDPSLVQFIRSQLF